MKVQPADSFAGKERTIRLTMRGGIQDFDAQGGTKAAPALNWQEGDKIYVQSSGAGGLSVGVAVYGSDGTWAFTYNGSLAARTDQALCYFFQGPVSEDVYGATLSYTSAVFEDPAASITFDGEGGGVLTAYLKPKVGRLRFQTDGQTDVQAIGLSGVAWYTSFDFRTFSFASVEQNLAHFPVGAGAYFYGFFPDDSRELVVKNDLLYFSRACSEEVLRAGRSGYMTVPTNYKYDGWTIVNPENLDAYMPIDFADANFKEWLVLRHDTDGDGEISRMEAKAVTEINNAYSTNVADLGGIEFFTNLQSLTWAGYESWDTGEYVVNNGLLTGVDLSRNTSLRYINLAFNQLSSLTLPENVVEELNLRGNSFTMLDLSGNSNLRTLYCYGNQMDVLSVADCPSLQVVHCAQNRLSTLDVSGCPSLRELSFEGNQVTSIDLSAAAELVSLNCSSNQLSSLDLRACKNLRWLNAENSDQLGSLNVSGLDQLESLYVWNCGLTELIISGCSALNQLNCTENQLTSLDLTGLSSLATVYCESNQLTSLITSGAISIQNLYCGGNQLEDLDVSGLTSLRELVCYANRLTALNLTGLSSLETVSCQNNQITSLSIQGCGKLRYLDFSTNRIADIDLGTCPSLEEVHAGWNPFRVLDVSSLTRLRGLWCEYSQLSALDLTACTSILSLTTYGSESLATVYVKTGQSFPDGLSVDGHTEFVHVDGTGFETGEITLTRSYWLKQEGNYNDQSIALHFDNGKYLFVTYLNTEFWDDSYSNSRHGIYLLSSNAEFKDYKYRIQEAFVHDVVQETWVEERLVLSHDGTVRYYMNDELLCDMLFDGLDLSSATTVAIEMTPYGWWTTHHHYMDHFAVTTPAVSVSDEFDSGSLDLSVWQPPANPDGVFVEDGVLKTIQLRTDADFVLRSKPLPLR